MIEPGMSTGEMGAFTGQPRSGNVTAAEESVGLVIDKHDLDNLMRENWRMEVKLLRNLVDVLCKRVIESGDHVEDYARRTREAEGRDEAPPRAG